MDTALAGTVHGTVHLWPLIPHVAPHRVTRVTSAVELASYPGHVGGKSGVELAICVPDLASRYGGVVRSNKYCFNCLCNVHAQQAGSCGR